MPEGGKTKRNDIVKDGVSRIIKDSEEVAVQAVNSAASVLKVGLDNAEELSIRAGDILLNAARRTIEAGNTLADDVHAATKNVVKNTVQTASEVGSEVGKMAGGVIKKDTAKSEKLG